MCLREARPLLGLEVFRGASKLRRDLNAATANATPAPKPPSIVTPQVDLWCVGLGSIVVLAPLVLFGDKTILSLGLSMTAILTMWINMPHFLASYRIVYRTKESILRHSGASIYLPAVLLAYCFYAVAKAETDFRHVEILLMVSSGYLAWHYTGQIWGMMATFGVLSGQPFNKLERNLIRTGLRLQLVWHVTWVLQRVPPDYPWLLKFAGNAYFVMSVLTAVAYALALAGFWLYRKRTGTLPPLRASIAWLALCFWYAAIARDRDAILLAQIGHAVQYLAFTGRVEANVYNREHPQGQFPTSLHVLIYFGLLIVVGFVVVWLLETPGVIVAYDLWGKAAAKALPPVLLAFINIHHYYTDGVIWKISSPTVKRDLFSHLPKDDKK